MCDQQHPPFVFGWLSHYRVVGDKWVFEDISFESNNIDRYFFSIQQLGCTSKCQPNIHISLALVICSKKRCRICQGVRENGQRCVKSKSSGKSHGKFHSRHDSRHQEPTFINDLQSWLCQGKRKTIRKWKFKQHAWYCFILCWVYHSLSGQLLRHFKAWTLKDYFVPDSNRNNRTSP